MLRAVDKWMAGYVRSVLNRPSRVAGLRHLLFGVADHFEPFGYGAKREEAVRAVERWAREYGQALAGFRDADGCGPRHTFFYPQEEYDSQCLDLLAGLCGGGCGEVEIHLHHRNDTAEALRAKLVGFRDALRSRHGLLGSGRGGQPRYGFVHGNWALCNSLPDGDWCGVNEELAVLSETGCYADFTFPSAPSPTQPRMVNAIYRAQDRPGKPRGADRGVRCRVSGEGGRWKVEGESRDRIVTGGNPNSFHPPPSTLHPSSSLMLIQGPLALDWKRRKWGVLPRLENAEVSAVNPATPRRVDRWVQQGIHVIGRAAWVFVKVHTHGCKEGNADVLLGESWRETHARLASGYNDGARWALHYVTAREMFNIVRAAEDGCEGNPGDYRDYEVGPPPAAARGKG